MQVENAAELLFRLHEREDFISSVLSLRIYRMKCFTFKIAAAFQLKFILIQHDCIVKLDSKS